MKSNKAFWLFISWLGSFVAGCVGIQRGLTPLAIVGFAWFAFVFLANEIPAPRNAGKSCKNPRKQNEFSLYYREKREKSNTQTYIKTTGNERKCCEATKDIIIGLDASDGQIARIKLNRRRTANGTTVSCYVNQKFLKEAK